MSTFMQSKPHTAFKVTHPNLLPVTVCLIGLCMVITYSNNSKDQPSKVANPARGQLNRENELLPVPVRAREFGLARRVGQSRPAPVCPSPYSG